MVDRVRKTTLGRNNGYTVVCFSGQKQHLKVITATGTLKPFAGQKIHLKVIMDIENHPTHADLLF